MKIFGIIMIVLGSILATLSLFGLIIILFNNFDSKSTDPAFNFGYKLGQFLLIFFFALLSLLFFKYGFKLFKKQKVKIMNREIDTIGE